MGLVSWLNFGNGYRTICLIVHFFKIRIEMVMSFAHVFPQLLGGLILFSLGLVFWRLLKFYENREHNKQLGWSNDLLFSF